MRSAEIQRRRGLTILLASQENSDITATVQAVRRAFPIDNERKRRFIVVHELPKDPQGRMMVDVRERMELPRRTLMFQWYSGPFSEMKKLRKLAGISNETLRAIAPHVLIVAQKQRQSTHHREPMEVLSLYRGFIDAQSRVNTAVRRNRFSEYPVDFDAAIGFRSLAYAFPEGELHMECVVARTQDGPQTRSTSASGIIDKHSSGDLIEREELLLYPIEIALRNLDRLREKEEGS